MLLLSVFSFFFFFNDTATTEIYTLSLHDALPISGELLHLAERHVDSFHCTHGKAGIAEIFGEDGIEPGGKVSRANDGLRLQRAQRVDVILCHAHDRRSILLFPSLHDLGLAPAALDHEWRRAVRMNEAAAALGQDRYELLISRHQGLEFVLRAAPHIEEERNEPYAFL